MSTSPTTSAAYALASLTLSAPTQPNQLHPNAAPVCPTCRLRLLDSIDSCDKCGQHYCVECLCPCDHVTTELAMATGLQRLWRTPPTPEQTFLVQDENGVSYGHSGPGDCFLTPPVYENEVTAGIHLLPEFIRLHERHQQLVIKGDDMQHYSTERFTVEIIFFDIKGREFTVSAFTRKQ